MLGCCPVKVQAPRRPGFQIPQMPLHRLADHQARRHAAIEHPPAIRHDGMPFSHRASRATDPPRIAPAAGLARKLIEQGSAALPCRDGSSSGRPASCRTPAMQRFERRRVVPQDLRQRVLLRAVPPFEHQLLIMQLLAPPAAPPRNARRRSAAPAHRPGSAPRARRAPARSDARTAQPRCTQAHAARGRWRPAAAARALFSGRCRDCPPFAYCRRFRSSACHLLYFRYVYYGISRHFAVVRKEVATV